MTGMHGVKSKLKSNPIRFEEYGSFAKHVYPEDPDPRVLYFNYDFKFDKALVDWAFQSLNLVNTSKVERTKDKKD